MSPQPPGQAVDITDGPKVLTIDGSTRKVYTWSGSGWGEGQDPGYDYQGFNPRTTLDGHTVLGSLGSISVAIDGYVYTGSGWKQYSDIEFTGALATKGSVLLAGIRKSSTYYTYGYYESTDNGASFHTPAETVGDSDAYEASLGTHAVNYLFVSGDVIFASTQNDGLWVCRDKKWSAEE